MTQRCVLFDMDGTIYASKISIQAIRDQLDLPQDGRPILEQLREAAPEVYDRGIKLLHAAEAEGAANGQLIPGTSELLSWLQEQDIRCALVTNNSRRSVDVILAAHPLSFDVSVTRDDAVTKPAPDLFLLALDRLECSPSEAVAIGDTHLDVLAAHRAGIREIYLVSPRDWMTEMIPHDIAYKAAKGLAEVHVGIEIWLRH